MFCFNFSRMDVKKAPPTAPTPGAMDAPPPPPPAAAGTTMIATTNNNHNNHNNNNISVNNNINSKHHPSSKGSSFRASSGAIVQSTAVSSRAIIPAETYGTNCLSKFDTRFTSTYNVIFRMFLSIIRSIINYVDFDQQQTSDKA